MTHEQLELFRICILQQLRVVGDGSLPVSTLVSGAHLAGFSEVTEGSTRATLIYLSDKGLVAESAKTISPENKRWRITAGGIDFLAGAGL